MNRFAEDCKYVEQVLLKGDVEGHEFRGNQYSGGGGSGEKGAKDQEAHDKVKTGQSISPLKLSNINIAAGTAEFHGETKIHEAVRVRPKGSPKGTVKWKLTGNYTTK